MKISSHIHTLILQVAVLPLLFSCAFNRIVEEPVPEELMVEPLDDEWNDRKEHLKTELEYIDSLEQKEDKGEDIYILSLDNFIQIAEDQQRVPRMIMLKANYYFDRAIYSKAIENYKILIKKYRKTPFFIEAMKKIARAYARNGEFENAEVWYKRLRDHGNDSLKRETRSNIAGVMFRNARQYERKGQYNKAGSIYFKIYKSFPGVDMAPRALFAAGRMKEKLGDWKRAIRIYQKILRDYYESSLVSMVMQREAMCWDSRKAYKKAAKKHLNVIRSFPDSREASSSLQLAGNAFEKAGERAIAARIYERYAELYPKNKDACEVIKRAKTIFQKENMQDNIDKLQGNFSTLCGS
ncbi:MAG: tetratricopeptide repeat protein [Fibrobacteria bacterium]|nr:tetratricopeptide repeat protein [Fibrobacteria bacterium]